MLATSFDAWVTVFTNGRWLDPLGLVQQLRSRKQLSGLLVSLHGATSASHAAFSGVRDSFGETLANIRLAVDNDVAVALSTIITRRNLHELEAVVDLGQQLGVQQVVFNRYLGSPLPAIEPSHDELRQAIRRVEVMKAQGMPVRYGICIPQCFASQCFRWLPGRRCLCLDRSLGTHAPVRSFVDSGGIAARSFAAGAVARPGDERMAPVDARGMHHVRCLLPLSRWVQGHSGVARWTVGIRCGWSG